MTIRDPRAQLRFAAQYLHERYGITWQPWGTVAGGARARYDRGQRLSRYEGAVMSEQGERQDEQGERDEDAPLREEDVTEADALNDDVREADAGGES